MPSPDPARKWIEEGERAMRICNACRYCEGFCAVFPALERRLTFVEGDLNFLANLCHDCGECLYSCQYAPPHEFGLDLPKTMARIRRETYRKYAWPGPLKLLIQRSGLALLAGAVAAPALLFAALKWLVPSAVLFSPHPMEAGAFFRVMPYTAMTALFTVLALIAVVAFVAGMVAFWRDMGEPLGSFWNVRALVRAVRESLSLRYLDGGGAGCAYPDEIPSQARRWFHHLTFYGFMLCFAATAVAAVYHNVLGWEAPYPLLSAPVVLGTLGGIGLLIGPVGLLWLKWVRDPERADQAQSGMDTAFLALLFLSSATGFLLLGFRESAAMGTLLAIHLGVVAGLFITMPYGKFVHAIYRFAALVRNALEEQRRAGRIEAGTS
ncbi:MAG TPA: tricarballylate utilization 4Fe-4S protein TcuB [Myxococcaceae bacterium]|nr:tricarballylate utilization 4Fe-4S protein TcuB [Myxococcaceae bacterium]